MLECLMALKGKTPNNKSETASDATNMFAIVRIRRFNNITRSVRKFPTNRKNTIRTYKPDSTITLAFLLDLNSLNISASWSSVESIFLSVNQFLLARKNIRHKGLKEFTERAEVLCQGKDYSGCLNSPTMKNLFNRKLDQETWLILWTRVFNWISATEKFIACKHT